MANFSREKVTRKLRGVIDLATGCYPSFVFGGSLGKILPVFHFHEVTQDTLEPQLAYLAENGYRTVTSEAISRFIRRGVSPGSSAVALCFDDAYASLWTVAGPLLRKYGFSAIAYAIPARIMDGQTLRPTIEEEISVARAYDASENPGVTWAEREGGYGAGDVEVAWGGGSQGGVCWG
jgi:peptidoglycan/xylan/chitin deacetylase (PgdA/CDA1 family)